MEATVTSAQELAYYDSELWAKDFVKDIPEQYLPMARYEPQSKGSNCIKYRGLYYYSSNPELPYVRLVKINKYPIPFICCCFKASYDMFKSELNTKYKDVDVSIYD